MTHATHTPGPWTLESVPDYGEDAISVLFLNGPDIALYVEADALDLLPDARLIAASPASCFSSARFGRSWPSLEIDHMPFRDWLALHLGTRKWVVAPRMTDRLRAKGYECCVTQERFQTLRQAYLADRKKPSTAPELSSFQQSTKGYNHDKV